MSEKTKEQVLSTTGVDGLLSKTLPFEWNRKVRLMRTDPTIGFVRDLYMAPILASPWTVVADSPEYEDAVQIIYDALVPQRLHLLRHTIRGLLDFGWQSFEKIFCYTADGWVSIKRLKPLLQDITDILVTHNGEMMGVRNRPTYLSSIASFKNMSWVDLTMDECAIFNRDVEGTDWYGEPLMVRVEAPYKAWNECEESSRRYDTKIAGAQWVVHYPPGTTKYNGVDTDNAIIARELLNTIKANGMIAIPRSVHKAIRDLSAGITDDNVAWKIELMEASGSSSTTFVDRQKYLDALKARGLGIPERAVFEGQFGTKAESEAHADFAIDNIEMGHVEIVAEVNQQLTNPLLEMNKGPQYLNKVKVVPMPLSDSKRATIKELYTAFFGTDEGKANEIENVDWDAVREQLGVPTRHEDVNESGDVNPEDIDPISGEPIKTSVKPMRLGRDAMRGELSTLGRRQLMNQVKAIKDMREEVSTGATPRAVAVEVLEATGVERARAVRLLQDVREPEASLA